MIKQIKDYPEYFINTNGEVFSTKYGKLKAMKQSTLRQRSNHKFVRLWKDGKSSKFYVHRLVLENFVGPCPEGMETRHKDDNPTNNNLDNLAWGSFLENIKDRLRNGRTPHKIGPEDVLQIRKLYSSGLTQKQIGKMFNLRQATIHQITSRKTWKHI